MIGSLNDNFGVIGFAIVGVFVVSWAASIIIYRINRYDEIEVNTDPTDRRSSAFQ
jgi:high-affinity nickel-transport protein